MYVSVAQKRKQIVQFICRNAAKKWEDFCIALRRDFHESPELYGQETQTIARICTELRAVGLSPIEVVVF